MLSATNQSEKANSKGFRSYAEFKNQADEHGGRTEGHTRKQTPNCGEQSEVTGGEVGTGTGSAYDR